MEQRSRLKWILIAFSTIFALTFVFYAVKLVLIRHFMASFVAPPSSVSTVVAESKTWHPLLIAAGTLKSSNGVDVNSPVSGQIMATYFTSGAQVQQGDLLVQLDDKVDQQTLLHDQAKLRFDKIDYQRKKLLLKEKAVAQSALDAARASYLQTEASVASDEVMIAQKKIKAPFSGKIGLSNVNVGQYITPSVSIASLQALDPLGVDFSLPEQNLPLISVNQPITISVDPYPKQVFNGTITAINSTVDVNTRTIAVRAIIPNPKETLVPGLFATVDVILPVVNNVITVPQSAVTYSMYGDSVYVVENKGKDKNGKPALIAIQKFVTVGDRRDNIVAITKGITAGEQVITAGQLKLQPGAAVVVNNVVTLE